MEPRIVLPTPSHRAVGPRKVLDRRLFCFDLALDLHPALPLGHDLHGGCTELRVLEHLETLRALTEDVVDRAHTYHAVKLHELPHLGLPRVLQEVHELPVGVTHPLRVQDLVTSANLEDGLEEARPRCKVAALHELLALLVAVGYLHPREDGAELLHLQRQLPGRVHTAAPNGVHVVGVVRDMHGGVDQPQVLALIVGEPHGHELGPLIEVDIL
mmetsp:Transcript_66556/g.142358  ORF Transcript_66556/g.142358 Transcript_66556/m.142358 type:complete len:214 (+) Transcript_66556:887-1528(+)